MRYATLIRDYRAQYTDPLIVSTNETVILGKRDTEWPEFIWGTDSRGKSGWIHERWLDSDHGTARVLRNYSALELDANAGERVCLIEAAGDWWWVENERGEQGWLPAHDLIIKVS